MNVVFGMTGGATAFKACDLINMPKGKQRLKRWRSCYELQRLRALADAE